MTNEEKIAELINIRDKYNYTLAPREVFDDAIKALETTCIEDYPTCTECEHYDSEKHYCPRFCQVIKDTLAEAQPMRDATEEERKSVKDYVESISKPTRFNFYEAQSCEDAVSREEVQDLISRWLSDYLLDETREALETINYKVGDMPSVTPKPKKGKWIVISCEPTDIFKCSECGMRVVNPYKYCPMCGSYNGGGEDGEDSAFDRD